MDKTTTNDTDGDKDTEKNLDDSKAVKTVKGILDEAGIDEGVQEEVVGKVKSLEAQRGKKAEKLSEYEELGDLEELQDQLQKDSEEDDDGGEDEPEGGDDDFSERFEEEWRKRKLEERGYPDDLTQEIRDWAEYKGISIEKAEQAEHIAPKIDEWERENRSQAASTSRRGQGKRGGTRKTDSEEYDMSTEEGRKAWEKRKEEMKKEHS